MCDCCLSYFVAFIGGVLILFSMPLLLIAIALAIWENHEIRKFWK